MGVAITKITLSKNTVGVNETFKIQVVVKETTPEPSFHRLPFELGREKGGIK